MATIRQTNFGSGELSPLLWGRTDLARWPFGLRTLRNFFVSHQGAAVSRPGTRYIAAVNVPGNHHRLVPFIYSDDTSYVLEFGHEYVRVYCKGAFVCDVVTTYQGISLASLQWVQSGDVLTLTHPDYPPRILTRESHAAWSIDDLDLSVPEGFEAHSLSIRDSASLTTEDVANGLVAKSWAWKASQLWRLGDGSVIETKATDFWQLNTGADIPSQVVLAPSAPITLNFPAMGLMAYELVGYRIYRGRAGLFGWVGDAEAEASTWVDAGNEPNYAISPRQGLNPFEIKNSSGAVVRTERPSAVAYYEERRVFGGTAYRPGDIWFSATGDYNNFDTHQVAVDSQSLHYELAARKREEIRAMASVGRLLIFTNSSVWSFGGSGGSPLAADVIPSARVQSEIGSLRLPPLVLEGTVLYARAKGFGVRSLSYNVNSETFSGTDVSSMAQHLFLGPDNSIVDWCYQEDPWGLVWVVRSDGTLLSLTFDSSGNGEVAAWSRHDTDGEVKSICSVPEGEEDAIYLVVARQNGTYLERMTSRVRRDSVEDDACVDSSVRSDAVPSLTISGLSHLSGQSVYAVSRDNPPYGPLTVVTDHITLPELPKANSGSNVVMHVGLGFTAEMETLDVVGGEARLKQKRVVSVGFEVVESKGLQVGQDLEHLSDWHQRKVSDSYSAISAATELVKVPVAGAWNEGARAALRQSEPLPVTVVGVSRELAVGE